jgi:hypothetical protein
MTNYMKSSTTKIKSDYSIDSFKHNCFNILFALVYNNLKVKRLKQTGRLIKYA